MNSTTPIWSILLWVAGILAFISHTPELGWAIWAVIWIPHSAVSIRQK